MKLSDMHVIFKRALLAILVGMVFPTSVYARDQIRIVGSSTVYPFAASAAEHFGRGGDYRTPVIEATGTGAGFKLFCQGIGDAFPDMADASRMIFPSERADCAKAGITHIIEAKIGFDGITLANSITSPRFSLTKKQLYLALARDIPRDGKMITNPYTRWQQIDTSLPNTPIKIYGTPPVSGTRDAFVELVMHKACSEMPEITSLFPDPDLRMRQCGLIREDGAFIEAGENGNLIAQKLMADTQALGILGFSFLDQNLGKLQGSVVDGIAPSFETIQNGSYAISRPLFVYIKGEQIHSTPGIEAFLEEWLSDAAIGEEGYLVNEGLVPLSAAEHADVRAKVLAELQR